MVLFSFLEDWRYQILYISLFHIGLLFVLPYIVINDVPKELQNIKSIFIKSLIYILFISVYLIVLYGSILFTRDLVNLNKPNSVKVIEGRVTHVSGYFLLPFIRQSVKLEGHKCHYYAYNSKFKVGDTYQIKVLPISRTIIEKKKIKSKN